MSILLGLGRLRTSTLGCRALGRPRGLAGGHGPTGYGDGPYRGIEPHLPGFWHTSVARAMGCVMWLWVFYRFKVDGKAFLVRRNGAELRLIVHIVTFKVFCSRQVSLSPPLPLSPSPFGPLAFAAGH